MFLLPACMPAAPGPEILASRDLDLPLDKERATVTVDVPPALPGMVEKGGKRLGLYLDGLDLGRGGYFEVYANLPPGAEVHPQGPHYLGTLSSYGPKGGGSTRVGYDLANLLRAVQAEGSWNGRLTLTFVRRSLQPGQGKTPAKAVPRVKRVVVVRE